jgi:hypothetical protein
MMKNRLRNIVSPLTPRNYPNMRELLLLFIFLLFPRFTGQENIVTTLNLAHREVSVDTDEQKKKGKKFIKLSLES